MKRPPHRTRAQLVVALVLMTTTACGRPAPRSPDSAPSIEVVHWLASREESAALSAAREAFKAKGGIWRETPLPGVTAAQSTVINRTAGGDPPAVFQVSVGAQLAKLAERNLVGPAPIDTTAIDPMLPRLIADAAKFEGRYVAVPAYVRGENWMFYNKALLARFDLPPPRTWPEFLSVARVLKAGGVTPLAIGGQPWQERILFNSVLLGIGGPAFYRRVYLDRDPEALASPTMAQVFETMAELRQYVDAASPGRPWPQATAMVLRGDAAFQFMGDWAKSSLRGQNGELDPRVGCALAPAREQAYIVAVDAFAFPKSDAPQIREGQGLFARVVLDPAIQRQMSLTLGSIPVSRAVSPDGFDACARIAMAATRDDARIVPSTGLFALPAPLSGAIDDSIGLFWHDTAMSSAAGQAAFARTMALLGPPPRRRTS